MRLRRRLRRERGAAAILTGLMITALVASAAITVDLGQQRVGRADMQALADVVALDLARQLDGRSETALAPVLNAEMARSLARNGDTYGAVPELEWDLGRIVDAEFDSDLSGLAPSAVRVTAATEVGFVFGGVAGIAEGGASRSAVAQSEGGACFSIGSYGARVDTGSSPILGPLLGALGSNVNVSAIDYNGLANADVSLLDLVGVDAGVGTLGALIEGGQLLSLADFYLATAEVLAQEGNAAFVGLLEAMAVGVDDVQLNAGDLIDLGTGGASGLDADLNLLDLVTAAAAAATGQNALIVPQVGVNLGPIANVGVDLAVIEAPKLGCGRKNQVTAKSTQVQVNLAANALDLNLLLAGTRVSLSGSIGVAQATGALTDVRCAPSGLTIDVSDGLLVIDLTLQITVYANILGVRIPVVGGPITIRGQTSTSGEAVIDLSDDAEYGRPSTVGSGTGGLPVLNVDTSGLALIGIPLGIVLAPIVDGLTSTLVNPLIQSLDTVLLSPLLNSLGIDLSGADIYKFRTPQCDEPKLVG